MNGVPLTGVPIAGVPVTGGPALYALLVRLGLVNPRTGGNR
ncbi:hypothetical protein [Kribbella solani]|uniref:Uncharacterized protein n=1 Tax=Kribbella solani TaxID=236067 RepID=A0A841DZN8_9ACTN|nr:hypothetical protein [Kribbella solani]MBB5982220.1 hypothetical protein [Kribbella solani]